MCTLLKMLYTYLIFNGPVTWAWAAVPTLRLLLRLPTLLSPCPGASAARDISLLLWVFTVVHSVEVRTFRQNKDISERNLHIFSYEHKMLFLRSLRFIWSVLHFWILIEAWEWVNDPSCVYQDNVVLQWYFFSHSSLLYPYSPLCPSRRSIPWGCIAYCPLWGLRLDREGWEERGS